MEYATTIDWWFRHVALPAIGAGALTALIVTLWVEWKDWRSGEWDRKDDTRW